MNGLIMKSSWIDRILAGQKTWELKGLPTKLRGRVALIRARTGRIVGTCEIVDCVGPLTLEQVQANVEKHGTPLEAVGQLAFAKTYAWVLANAKSLAEPIELTDCRGGTWVRLTAENVGARFGELEGGGDVVEQPKVKVTVCCPQASLGCAVAPVADAKV